MYKVPNKEIENPILQRNRATSLFRMFLQSKGIQSPLKSYIIFIHPQCTIYQTPLNQQIIFHSNIQSFLTKLNENQYSSKKSQSIVKVLESSVHQEFLPENSLSYTFDELQKGIPCCQCGSMNTELINRTIKCSDCETEEVASDSIIRCINEFQELFPSENLTSGIISKWCGNSIAQARCKRMLLKHFSKRGETKNVHYIKEEEAHP